LNRFEQRIAVLGDIIAGGGFSILGNLVHECSGLDVVDVVVVVRCGGR
jgi:hypothetical protein